ncbi:iron complex transport system substrate-binding protein [Rhodopseudomonas julia]|uniref:Iron complex transport system substrate-binding protein n=1 Tax=Rhodopseudomonas julia TaxID=200617 RepID=A0ABU0C2Z7_9BRAD|nr:ABC transporter substrate-binding protein [Rhodopseudomonas julia]MDQ0324885.1 iron complex transport system substrate-binding protein [Rhodopseudomonas julia]
MLRHLLAAILILATAGPAAAKPQHVVSINLCADQLLMRLADPEQIASLTYLARDASMSNLSGEARSFPANRGLAEEVVRYEPDLVLAGRYTKRVTTDLLKRIGINVLELDAPRTIEEVEAQIRLVGGALGQEARADTVIREMEQKRLRAEDGAAQLWPTAVVYEPNGYTVGAGSLIDTLLSLAGLRNLAAERGIQNYGRLPLESLVTLSPDVLIIGPPRETPALATELVRHPVLWHMPRPMEIATVPPRLWICAGPDMFEAVAILREAAAEARTRP